MEGGPTDNGDQMYCPLPFECVEDYLICLNHAWPKIAEIMAKGEIREGWVSLLVIPPQVQDSATEAKLLAQKQLLVRLEALDKHSRGRLDANYAGSGLDPPTNAEMYMMCGPKRVYCRLTVAELEAARATLREGRFDFAERYPCTDQCLKKATCVTAEGGLVLNNVWFKTHRAGRVVVAKGMKSVKEERIPKKVLHESTRPCVSVKEVFEGVEEVLKGCVEGPGGGGKKRRVK